MCMFPILNPNLNSIAYKKGLHEFDCGACPECLAKRARSWSLRSFYESRNSPACMITLTYDSYLLDLNGRIVGEKDPDSTLAVNKRDCQLFIKRLRKHFSDIRIKYLLTAEYGKKTHRAHYHALLFGVVWDDLVFYKKSKRGNVIYKSPTLTKLWGHGICTVDAINVTAQVARYCTKYCAKDSRCDDTFMLFSRGIGEKGLLEDFNGVSYFVDGREYPIPKQIWQKKISEWYNGFLPEFTYKYKNRLKVGDTEFYRNARMRRNFCKVRDADPDYQYYLAYWQHKAEQYLAKQPVVEQRILQLPDAKYYSYKVSALKCLAMRNNGILLTPPRSNCKAEYFIYKYGNKFALPFPSCHERANDTTKKERIVFLQRIPYEITPFDNKFENNLDIFSFKS